MIRRKANSTICLLLLSFLYLNIRVGQFVSELLFGDSLHWRWCTLKKINAKQIIYTVKNVMIAIIFLTVIASITSCISKQGEKQRNAQTNELSDTQKSETRISQHQEEMIGNSDPNAKDDLSNSFVAVVTNKKLYSQGESIKIKVKNNLTVPIWYINFTQRDLVFWSLEKFQNNMWEALYFRLPVMENGKEICRLTMYERPIGVVKALLPNSLIDYKWNQKLCRFEGANVTKQFDPKVLDRGKYRLTFRYSLKTVKVENNDTEPWRRPLDLGETQLVYSNEFTVK